MAAQLADRGPNPNLLIVELHPNKVLVNQYFPSENIIKLYHNYDKVNLNMAPGF